MNGEHPLHEVSCRQFRRTVLGLPDPRQAPPSLRGHSERCPDCHLWFEQAVELEESLSRLSAPSSARAKAQLLAQLQQSTPSWARALPLRRSAVLWQRIFTGAGLAAAILAAVVVYRVWPERSGEAPVAEAPPYPLLQRVVEHDLSLARAASPAQRIQALSELAETLAQETGTLARIASADELRDLVRWYNKVVERGLVPQAEEWIAHRPLERERRQLLEAAEKLAASAAAAEVLLAEVPPHAQPVLRHLVQTAREGEQKLKRLCGV